MNTSNTAVATPSSAASADTTLDGLNRFHPYTSDLPITVPEGMRLVKCLYKTNLKTGNVAGENSYIIVPESHLSEEVVIAEVATLAPYISAYLQEQEDKIIKEAHKNKSIGFSDAFLSVAKILEALDASGQGNRLNKDKIESWYNSDMKEQLLVAFADKMGLSDTPSDEEITRLSEISEVYKAKYASLASGKTLYKKEEAELLIKALTVTGAGENGIGARFVTRLEGMKTHKSEELLLSL